MAVNKVPLSGGKADGVIGNISAARTGTSVIASPSAGTDLILLFTAGTYGGFIDYIPWQFIGTSQQAAALIYLWKTDTSGANAQIFRVITVSAAAAAMSNTNKGPNGIESINKNFAAGVKVYASLSVLTASGTLNVDCDGGQFEGQ